jgi:hypothetical protein
MRGLLLTAAALAALVPGTLVAAPSATDPKTLVLQPAGMPADFRRAKVRYVSNAQAAKEAEVKKNYTRLGRIQGYEATYEKKGTRGILVVVTRASTYKTAAGAGESLALDARGAEKSRTVRFRRVRGAAKVGDESHMFRASVKQGRTTVEIYSVAWRSGKVYAAVIGSGLAGTGKPWFVVKLAKRQQARIARG